MMSLTDYNLTPKAKKAIKDAQLFAKENKHELIRNAHLFYSCIENLSDRVQLLFESRGIDCSPNQLRQDFISFSLENPKYFKKNKNSSSWHEELNQIISDAKDFADTHEEYFVGVEHILHCLLSVGDGSSFLSHLKKLGQDIAHMEEVIYDLVDDPALPIPDTRSKDRKQEDWSFLEDLDQPVKYLTEYCTDLNLEACQVDQNPITSRDSEIEDLIEILSRKDKSNAVLVGEAGVGKTAVVEGLAQKIINGDVPTHIAVSSIYSVDIASMIAGTQYRGQFEERFKGLLKEVEGRNDIILFFDEIHTMIGAGSSNDSSLDAANMLKPALARGTIKCIGATTSKEYKKSFDKDPSIKRRFDKVEISEPTKAQTEAMIKGSLPHYEKYHKVKYTNKNIQDILDLSEIYLSHKKFPDKAFDIVDHVGSRAKIKNDYCPEELKEIRDKFALAEGDTFDEREMESFVQDYVKELVSFVDSEDKVARVTRDDILDVLEKKTGIPKKTIGESSKSFKVFKSKMKKEIFGQEECIDKVYNTLTCVKAGLNDPEKPLTNFLFVGPTSVGKTFTAKNIAKHFFGNSNAFLQLNMSEYQDKTAMSKLLGANAGYVGYEEGGILTDFVRDNPNSVILFDEIEKSEPKILDLLLHLLDEGYVSDNLNRRVNFNKCIIVLTTNIGHASASKRSVGFVDDNHEKEAYNNSLKKQLRPELLARVENTVIFNGLNDSIMANIVGSEISKLKLRLKAKNVALSINKRVKDLVVAEIKLKKLNARDIKSLVVRMIQFPLADFMINNEGKEKISLKVVDKKVIIS